MKFSTKLSYGVGQFSDGVKQAAFNTFLFFYYNQILGLSASLAGLAALVALVVDAVSDPMVGQWSDRIKTRLGRRHPFMLAGIAPFAITIYLLFAPPAGLSETTLFFWMVGFAVLVRIALTLFFVPHLSLGAELASGYHERTSLIGYRVFFTYFGILAISVIGFVVFFPNTEAFPNGLMNAASYPSFGLFCAFAGALAMLVSTLGTMKSIPTLAATTANDSVKKRGAIFAIADVFTALKQKAFRVVFTSSLYFNSLAGLIQTLTIYIATYIFGFSPETLGILALALVVAIIFASNIAQFTSKRMDKRAAASLCVVIGACIAVIPTCFYLLGWLQPMSEGSKILFVFLANGISQAFFIAFVILVDSMLTDSIDQHYLDTGKREEGLFFAARAFATKASYGIGAFLAGIALEIIAFPKEAAPQDVPAEAVWNLALFAGPGCLVLFAATMLFIRRFPIDRIEHDRIMGEIERSADR